MRREEKRREEKKYRETLVRVALALSLVLGVLPAAAQSTGIQPVWLLADDTSQLGDLLFGPGVAEVPTFNPGATTAGGTVSWVRYFEKDDHLGMHHVYYRQQYHHSQLGRTLNVLGTAVSLHYAPHGSLSHADLAQVSDVPPLPNVALSTPQQAFAAAQLGLASWPGFDAGNPALWPAGTLASILDRSELMLDAPRGVGGCASSGACRSRTRAGRATRWWSTHRRARFSRSRPSIHTPAHPGGLLSLLART